MQLPIGFRTLQTNVYCSVLIPEIMFTISIISDENYMKQIRNLYLTPKSNLFLLVG